MKSPTKALLSIARELGEDRVRLDEPLAPYTTYRIGGPADCLYGALTADDLVRAIAAARRHEVPFFVLGLGANILVGDGGIRGLVIRNRCSRVAFLRGNQVLAESGVVVGDLIDSCRRKGLSGLEHFAGIPSSVGGALWQNLHFLAPDRQRTIFIEECLDKVTILTEQNRIVEVTKDYFQFGYDESILHRRRDTVLTATFRLRRQAPESIQRIIEDNILWRSEKHPNLEQFPSAGSVFKKIEGMGAGRLIDQCGLKGFTLGGAQISPKHANFIVNTGEARASEVLQLIRLCQEKVKRRFGVDLTPEISLVGEF